MSKTLNLIIVGASLCTAGCTVDAEDNLGDALGEDAHSEPMVAHTEEGRRDGVDPAGHTGATSDRPCAVYLLRDDSPVVPWCSGALVAPDVVVTSSACAEPGRPAALSVGFDTPNRGAEIDVAEVVGLDSDPRVVALILGSPVDDVEPASVAVVDKDRCEMASISYLFVLDPEPSERWEWTGCYEARTHNVTPTHGEPNCHGDAGAPVFAEPGVLAGIVVEAHASTETCVDTVELAVPFDGGPFEEAMALSGAPS